MRLTDPIYRARAPMEAVHAALFGRVRQRLNRAPATNLPCDPRPGFARSAAGGARDWHSSAVSRADVLPPRLFSVETTGPDLSPFLTSPDLSDERDADAEFRRELGGGTRVVADRRDLLSAQFLTRHPSYRQRPGLRPRAVATELATCSMRSRRGSSVTKLT